MLPSTLRTYITFSHESIFVSDLPTVWPLVPGITTTNNRHYDQADSASKRSIEKKADKRELNILLSRVANDFVLRDHLLLGLPAQVELS